MAKESKRQSGSRRPTLAPLPNLPAVFLDATNATESLVASLTAKRIKSEKITDHFAANTPDHVWLPFVGKKGWLILTKDSKFKYRPTERIAFINAHARAFVIVTANMSGEQIADMVATAIPEMKKFIRDNPAPFIAKIHKKGHQVKIVKIL